MPVNWGDMFSSKGQKGGQSAGESRSDSSLDIKDKFSIHLPQQTAATSTESNQVGVQGKVDPVDQNKKIPWNIPFLNMMKPFQFPKEDGKGDITSKVQKSIGSGALQWTTTTKVRQKKKELMMYSPSSF